MGYEIINRQNGYWNKETVYNETLSLSIKLGHFPTRNERKEFRIGTVDFYASKFYSGLEELRNIINEELEKSNNYNL